MGTAAPKKGSTTEDNLVYISVPNVKLPDLVRLVKTKVSLNEENINLIYTKGAVHATQEKCPHAGGPLHLGDIEELPQDGLCVKCPWHSWRFSILTGKCVFPGTDPSKKLKIYPVQVDKDVIKIGFDQIAPKYFTTPPEKPTSSS